MPFNLCNLPPWVLSSVHYNRNPQPIELQGVRTVDRRLFARLDQLDSPEERALVFHDYVSVKFQLHRWAEESSKAARLAIKNGYLRYLRGWGVDSCGMEGAVLKGWVESRMGLMPTFHRAAIRGPDDESYAAYLADRMNGSAKTNNVFSQFDLVYEFCQYELARRRPGERHLTLYRGVHPDGTGDILAREGKRDLLVRMNNLVSFTFEAERAWEFGTTVWEVQVPVFKVFFFSGLFPTSLLRGEEEVLAVGGEYQVRVAS